MAQPLKRSDWLPLARDLAWDFSYVKEEEVFPPELAGRPWLTEAAWKDWEEPFKTSYTEYVTSQSDKDQAVKAVQDLLGRVENLEKLPVDWLNSVKLHAAALPLAEFAATIGNLRAARFGRTTAWRNAALFGALDELRHTQIPLRIMSPFVQWDPQFDWTQKFYHTKNWVAIAARHLFDEILLTADPIEFAVATNFIFETAFTNLQFIGLSSFAQKSGDHLFEKMVKSIQTDEARHAQIGLATAEILVRHDRERVQALVDKWFWRSWLVFSVLTGISMDYLTPVDKRSKSFKELVHEWIIDQFLPSLEALGLKKPWYWDLFMDSTEVFHHMIYASAYTYRATVWFDMVVPGPKERAWLKVKYPKYWDQLDEVWENIARRWEKTDPGVDFGVHGTAIVTFCNMCQMVLCGGTPQQNTATSLSHEGKKYIFCSRPCRWIFEQEKDRYKNHRDIVKRVLHGEAPGNVMAMITQYFDLTYDTWGKDAYRGEYPWLRRPEGKI